MNNATNAAAEMTLTDADFDLDNMFPAPAPLREPTTGRDMTGTGLHGANRDDAAIADADNLRPLRSRRPSRSKVR